MYINVILITYVSNDGFDSVAECVNDQTISSDKKHEIVAIAQLFAKWLRLLKNL